MIPSFEEFLKTITEEKVNSWTECIEPPTLKISNNGNGDYTMDASKFVAINFIFTKHILCEYHEWLSKQITENINNESS